MKTAFISSELTTSSKLAVGFALACSANEFARSISTSMARTTFELPEF